MSPIDPLREDRPSILPSMLQNDFCDIRGLCRNLETSGIKGLHLDVMDGNFVPNMSYGLPIVQAFRQSTSLVLDCHLMINAPDRYVRAFVEAGADVVTVHAEAVEDLGRCLDSIHDAGAAAGVALNPDSPLDSIADVSDRCDLILIMSVQAGFGGQAFREESLERLKAAAELPGDFLLEVDGGINESTIAKCAQAGADLLVAGSAIFAKQDHAAAIADLMNLVHDK